jgi:type II secretory pathway component PulJ
MKNNKGYSLIEVMMAAALGALVISSTIGFLVYFFSEKTRLDNWSTGQLEMSMAIKNIEREIRNVVRLEPSEDLRIAKDELYFGLTSIPAGEEPAVCLNDDTHAVFRYTTLSRSLRQEKSMRAWSEVTSANKNLPSDELRVTTDNTDAALFSEKNLPGEILAVDADRRFIRRYRVISRTPHLNSVNDPYDDAPKTNAAGNPIYFDYASVFLGLPTGILGTKTTLMPAVFVTGSDIYASTTYFVCMHKTENKLIKYNPLKEAQEVLLAGKAPEFVLQSFVVKYLATKKDVRVDPVNFVSSTLNDTGVCVNTVHITMTAENLTPNTAGLKDTQTEVSRSRTVFATNLGSRRPLKCLE